MKRKPVKKPTATITLPQLVSGEQYAGIVLSKGKPTHHLILLAGEIDKATWTKARAWAKKQGGELPTRPEQALLFANVPEEFKPEWYWSSEQHASNPSSAWVQSFIYGYQNYYLKDSNCRARAVRRLEI
jgi:hypothetical protein